MLQSLCLVVAILMVLVSALEVKDAAENTLRQQRPPPPPSPVIVEDNLMSMIIDPSSPMDGGDGPNTIGRKMKKKKRVQHRCIHDEVHKIHSKAVKLNASRTTPTTAQNNNESSTKGDDQHSFQKLAVGPLRVTISTVDLDDSTHYCSTVGQSIDNHRGENVECRDVDILTNEKRTILKDRILPAAIKQLSEALYVEQRTTNIIVPSTACSPWAVPSSHLLGGVENTDYILYVSAVPTTKNPVPTAEEEIRMGATLAFASGCMDDGDRFIAGRANWGPHFIEWGDADAEEEQVATAVHELLHALGFSSAKFGNRETTGRIREKDVTYFAGAKATAQCAAFLNCPTVQGCELEDEGGTGSAGSHFDRRLYLQEMMAAAGGRQLSAITLAAMEDLGYTPQYDKAQPMTFGKNAGCGFVDSLCDTDAGGRGQWWCFDENIIQQCTRDSTAIGYCNVRQYTADLPSYFQYFSDPTKGGPEFTDKCPFIQAYSNRLCDVDLVESTNDYIIGNYYGSGGRCFTVTGLVDERYTLPDPSATSNRCLRTQCLTDGSLQFQVNASGWISCPSSGATVSNIPNFKGSVSCPGSISEFCSTASSGGTAAPGAVATPSPPNVVATTASPGGQEEDPSPTSAPLLPTSAPSIIATPPPATRSPSGATATMDYSSLFSSLGSLAVLVVVGVMTVMS